MVGEHLTGNYRVRGIGPAFQDVWRLVDKMSDNIEIRRHALKLRYWPKNNPVDDAGQVLDLDWSWIRSLPRMRIGELRVNDVIGGKDNLRIIFLVGDSTVCKPLPVIWVLRVMQKTRNDFSRYDLSIFRARRTLIMERFYGA